MDKHGAIPEGYMTVGQLAKRMGTTVRTLQYYDKENVLKPSAESEGGRRLYTDKDMIQLHQILSLKSLGFSLDDIKGCLVSLDTPADVANVLTDQAASIKMQIESLAETLTAIEALKEEVLQMQTVDFKKYADIITNLQMQNKYYWLIKHFDEKTLEYCRTHFNKESALEIIETLTRLNTEAIQLQSSGISPESKEGQKFAQSFWNMIQKFTGGDMSLLPKLMEIGSMENATTNDMQKPQLANDFIGAALGAYFKAQGINPFEGVLK